MNGNHCESPPPFYFVQTPQGLVIKSKKKLTVMLDSPSVTKRKKELEYTITQQNNSAKPNETKYLFTSTKAKRIDGLLNEQI